MPLRRRSKTEEHISNHILRSELRTLTDLPEIYWNLTDLRGLGTLWRNGESEICRTFRTTSRDSRHFTLRDIICYSSQRNMLKAMILSPVNWLCLVKQIIVNCRFLWRKIGAIYIFDKKMSIDFVSRFSADIWTRLILLLWQASRLNSAAINGNMAEVESLLRSNADVNLPDQVRSHDTSRPSMYCFQSCFFGRVNTFRWSAM